MEREYIGVDLHKVFFQACAVDPSGIRQWEGRFPQNGCFFASHSRRPLSSRMRLAAQDRRTWIGSVDKDASLGAPSDAGGKPPEERTFQGYRGCASAGCVPEAMSVRRKPRVGE
jgi:hypothetical protein